MITEQKKCFSILLLAPKFCHCDRFQSLSWPTQLLWWQKWKWNENTWTFIIFSRNLSLSFAATNPSSCRFSRIRSEILATLPWSGKLRAKASSCRPGTGRASPSGFRLRWSTKPSSSPTCSSWTRSRRCSFSCKVCLELLEQNTRWMNEGPIYTHDTNNAKFNSCFFLNGPFSASFWFFFLFLVHC